MLRRIAKVYVVFYNCKYQPNLVLIKKKRVCNCIFYIFAAAK